VPGQLTLLDAPSLWYRAFHGVPESVIAPDGSPVNLVRGTIDLIARIVKDTRPSRLVACLDNDWRPAFRVAAIPSYKAHRLTENGAEAEPATLAHQVGVLLEVLEAVGIATAGVDGYEADDVLGTLSARETGAVDVVTGDRDMFQLVRDEGPVRVLYTVEKMAPYTPGTVAAKYGIPGTAYAEYAVLWTDKACASGGAASVVRLVRGGGQPRSAPDMLRRHLQALKAVRDFLWQPILVGALVVAFFHRDSGGQRARNLDGWRIFRGAGRRRRRGCGPDGSVCDGFGSWLLERKRLLRSQCRLRWFLGLFCSQARRAVVRCAVG